MAAAILPPEILLLIFDELEETQDRLRALQVCKHWNNVLFAKVYSSIKLSFLSQKLSRKAPASNPSFTSFESRRAAGLNIWEKRLDHRDIYSWLAVVLISLPKLQHLDILWGGFGDYAKSTLWAVSTVAKKSPSAQVPLQHLRKLTARIQDDDGIEFSIRQFTPFLHLPAMQALHLSGMVDGDAADAKDYTFGISSRRLLRKSPVCEMVLRGSSILSDLPALIAVCARLESFEYQHHNDVNPRAKIRNYRCRPFHDALVTQKESLRSLRLNDAGVSKMTSTNVMLYDWENDDQENDADIQEAKAQAWFGSLIEFAALKELRIPVRNLLDSTGGKKPNMALTEILPPSLEVLVLAKVDTVEYAMLGEQLRGLLDVREQKFPSLRKILLQPFQVVVNPGEKFCWEERNWGVSSHAEMAFEGVRRSCEEQDVEFGFFFYGDFQVLGGGKVVQDTDDFGGYALY